MPGWAAISVRNQLPILTQPSIVIRVCKWEVCVSPTAIFPGELGLAGFIDAKDDGGGSDNSSYKSCKAPVNRHHQQRLLQAGSPSCHPSNSAKALKENSKWGVAFADGLRR